MSTERSAPKKLSNEQVLSIDRQHIWHPYSSFDNNNPIYAVESANGVRITLKTGESLIDGMSSWWSVLHGYNNQELNHALTEQLSKMAHVMFGGLTHEPAARLAKQLTDIAPAGLNKVFFSDSGSVAVEVALKMALQYWQGLGQTRRKFLTLKKGYHGDTIAAMSVCDPITGMHHMFNGVLMQQLFAEQPQCRINDEWDSQDISSFESLLSEHKNDIAGVILEPIVQGTGGMHFYHPEYLRQVRQLTERYGIPLIADEIATGMGRTGRMFACEHSGISPDIMCLGKTLSAGYITFAATLCSDAIAETICANESGVFMHGPTFMGNPLACAVASKSIELLQKNNWEQQVTNIERWLSEGLAACKTLSEVEDVRVLGSIGVVEMKRNVDLKKIQPALVARGVWLRPFGRLIYTMPPYISTQADIETLCREIFNVISNNHY